MQPHGPRLRFRHRAVAAPLAAFRASPLPVPPDMTESETPR